MNEFGFIGLLIAAIAAFIFFKNKNGNAKNRKERIADKEKKLNEKSAGDIIDSLDNADDVRTRINSIGDLGKGTSTRKTILDRLGSILSRFNSKGSNKRNLLNDAGRIPKRDRKNKKTSNRNLKGSGQGGGGADNSRKRNTQRRYNEYRIREKCIDSSIDSGRHNVDIVPTKIELLRRYGRNDISQYFGETNFYLENPHLYPKLDGHEGVDYKGKKYQPIHAAHNGKVLFAGFSKGPYGNYVILYDPDQQIRTYYCHLNSLSVTTNIIINAGNIIGTMGMTGFTTGVHEHFGLMKTNNKAIGINLKNGYFGFIDPYGNDVKYL